MTRFFSLLILRLCAGFRFPVAAALVLVFLVSGMARAVAEYRLPLEETPIVLRSAMPDSSARSIAVGLPEGSAFCFDAAKCRFRYVWSAEESGEFLDMRPLWTGRGGRDLNVLGERWYTAPDAFPLRFGEADAEPAEVRFRGYRLIEGIPEFLYEADGVQVREKITAADGGGNTLVRSFELGPAGEDVWFYAGTEENGAVVSSPNGDFSDGLLRVPGGDTVRFEIRIEAASPAAE